MEKRLNDNILSLKESMSEQAEGLSKIALNLDTLYDRMCSNENKSVKKTVIDDISDDEKVKKIVASESN